MIEDELDGAECYAEKALKYKDEKPSLSKMFFSLANEEMDHMDRLHGAVVDEIEEYRNSVGQPPAAMQAVYDYLHEKHIEQAKEIKVMLAMYKEG